MRHDPGSREPTPRRIGLLAYQQILGVLGADQLNVLARVVGQLAVTRSPNFEEAALGIERTLSEKQVGAILTARAWLDRQMSDLYEALKRETLKQQSSGVQHLFGRDSTATERAGDNPGMILLAFAIEELWAVVTDATYGA